MILIEEKTYSIDLSEDDINKYIKPYVNEEFKFKELVKATIKKFHLKTLNNEDPKYSLVMYSETYPEIINVAIFIFKINIVTEENVL